MKAHLLYEKRDVDLQRELPWQAEALEQDLGLGTILNVMAAADPFLREVAGRTLLNGLTDSEEILYRQDVLSDFIQKPEVAHELYALAIEALKSRKEARFFLYRDSPDTQLSKSLRMLELLLDVIRRLRAFADREEGTFRSLGLRTLVGTIEGELNDEYLTAVENNLRELRFKRGPLISARLGRGNCGTGYALRKPFSRGLLDRITPGGPRGYSFSVPARDENGLRALGELRNRGLVRAADAIGQAVDHILSFFTMLRAEAGFYVACLNLHEELRQRDEPVCFPIPRPTEEGAFTARDLYDAALTFHLSSRVVGNDVDADGLKLVMITGANQGGKSTFLRSVGIAQLMLQAGMFVPATELAASVSRGLFTHFSREEDASMTRGKLAEELSRMSMIAEAVESGSVVLCNESFSSTNEREGSEIARQLIHAFGESGVRAFYVTHLYDLAQGFYDDERVDFLFLRAERHDDGSRPFKLRKAAPLPTSYGADSYRRIFGKELASEHRGSESEALARPESERNPRRYRGAQELGCEHR
jgi:MutS domain V